MSELAAAEAVFGSASRRDGDALSDRDILIVDSDTALLRDRQKALENEGWSVASYTFLKLEALARKGVLFLQHLKAESTIHRDLNGQLRSILDGYRPKDSYSNDLQENARLANLIAFRPNCHSSDLWAADVLYVTTRNFGILTLAQTGRYIFSYSKIVEALADQGVVRRTAVNDLLQLRTAKMSYRSDRRFGGSAAAALVERSLHSLPESAFPRQSVAIAPRSVILHARALPAEAPSYHRLRHLEKTYLAALALRPTRGRATELAELTRWIENPRAYASFAATQEYNVISHMQRTAGLLGPTGALFGRNCRPILRRPVAAARVGLISVRAARRRSVLERGRP
jgi:hypothetical protein